MYDKQKEYKKACQLIVDNELILMEEVVSLLPMSTSTFYVYYPDGSEESEHLKELINNNKVNTKIDLRKDFKTGSSTEKIVLYKLCATSEERNVLSDKSERASTAVDLAEYAKIMQGAYTTKDKDES